MMANSNTPNSRPRLDGRPGSKRSLLQARSLSRRFVRTLSEMLEEETLVEESSCSSSKSHADDQEDVVAPSNSQASRSHLVYARASSARNMMLVKSLSKRLLNTISQIIDEENGSHVDKSNKPDEEGNDPDTKMDPTVDNARPNLLARSLSKKLIRTISQIVDDQSIENSLDIFAEPSNHDDGKRREDLDIPKWAVIESNQTPPKMDEFDSLMRSLMKDESFQNSLNDWMGSLSDVFDENKRANGTRLTEKDHEAMNTNVEHMRDLGQYLRQSLSCRDLLPDDAGEDIQHFGFGRRRNFRRCQSYRESKRSTLSEVAECEFEDALPSTPSLVIPASPSKVFSSNIASERPSVAESGTFVLEDDVSSELTDTDGTSFFEEPEPTERTIGSLQNASFPKRMPSPRKSPCTLRITLSDDMKQNAAPPRRVPSPVKTSSGKLNKSVPLGLQCTSLE